MNRLVPWLMMLTLGAGLYAQPQASNWLLGPGIVTSPVYEEKRLMLSFREDTVAVVELPNPEPEWIAAEAISSISDSTGQLLYYSDNIIAYNMEHGVLANSEGLNVTGWSVRSTMTNGVLFLPLPGDEEERFHVLFTINEDPYSSDVYKLQWSLIDRILDGGRGAIIDTLKGRFVWDFMIQEKLAVVRHANGRDWWLAARKATAIDSLTFELSSSVIALALVTPDGVFPYGEQTTPVTLTGQYGEMLFSKDGSILAEASMPFLDQKRAYVSIYSFDRCTGVFTWRDSISAASIGTSAFYGLAMDARASKLYVGTWQGILRIYQLSIADLEIDSVQEVFRFGPGYNFMGQLELGPDNRIYGVFYPDLSIHPLGQHLGVIAHPSAFGPACGFDTFGVALGASLTGLALPPQPNYALGALEGSGCDTLGSTSSAEGPAPPAPWSLHPNPASDRAWMEGLPEGSSWVLMDVLGRPLRNGFARQGRASVELDGLARGLYLMIVQPPGGAPLVRRLMVSGR